MCISLGTLTESASSIQHLPQHAMRILHDFLESLFDPEVRLYYRFYRMTAVGHKYLCVVVKMSRGDAFVLTAYLTDSIKRGWRLWPETA